jgi:hypothetical protein
MVGFNMSDTRVEREKLHGGLFITGSESDVEIHREKGAM